MISTTHFRILALSVFAVATFFPVLSNARSIVFDDIIVNEGAAKRGPELKMTSVVVGKVLDGVIVREPMPLMAVSARFSQIQIRWRLRSFRLH